MIADLERMKRELLAAIQQNTAAINENTRAMRELLAKPDQRISGVAGMPTGEAMGPGKVTKK